MGSGKATDEPGKSAPIRSSPSAVAPRRVFAPATAHSTCYCATCKSMNGRQRINIKNKGARRETFASVPSTATATIQKGRGGENTRSTHYTPDTDGRQTYDASDSSRVADDWARGGLRTDTPAVPSPSSAVETEVDRRREKNSLVDPIEQSDSSEFATVVAGRSPPDTSRDSGSSSSLSAARSPAWPPVDAGSGDIDRWRGGRPPDFGPCCSSCPLALLGGKSVVPAGGVASEPDPDSGELVGSFS